MNIYAQHGDKVVFTNPIGDGQHALQFLTLNEVYTVERTDVYDWHTDVYLQEVPGVGFNSVMFEDVE